MPAMPARVSAARLFLVFMRECLRASRLLRCRLRPPLEGGWVGQVLWGGGGGGGVVGVGVVGGRRGGVVCVLGRGKERVRGYRREVETETEVAGGR